MSVEFPVVLKITGLDKIRDALAKVPHEIRVVANRVVDEEIRNKVYRRAQQLAPVRTGRLRNSIYVKKTGFLGWNLGAGIFYAGFVEFGTRYMRARPFLRPAVEEGMPEVREELKDALTEKMFDMMK